MKRKIGFFGGTFDPVHFGHLSLAIQIAEIHHLEEVVFSPAFCSPHKQHAQPKAEPHHRLRMLKLAIGDIPYLRLATFEIDQKKPSFAIDAVQTLQEENPGAQLYLILGEDALIDIARWKDVHRLFGLAPPLMGSRPQTISTALAELPLQLRALLQKGFTTIHVMEISSTMIRQRIKEKKVTRHLLPKEVQNYIAEQRLYE